MRSGLKRKKLADSVVVGLGRGGEGPEKDAEQEEWKLGNGSHGYVLFWGLTERKERKGFDA